VDAVVFAHARQALQSEGMKPRHAIALVGWYLMVPTFCVPGNPVPCLWDPGRTPQFMDPGRLFQFRR
jgi:hypothetical protein